MKQLTTSINGLFFNQIVVANTIQKPQSAINATMYPSGVIADTTKQLTTAVSASQVIPGSVADTMLKPLTSVQVAQIDSGVIPDAIPAAPSTAVAGFQSDNGTVATAIGQASSSVNAAEAPNGFIATTMQQLQSNAVGTESPQGSIAVALALATSALTGTQAQIGTIVDVLTKAQTSLIGAQIQSGSIATALQQAITAISAGYAAAPFPNFDSQATPFVSASASSGSVTLTLGTNSTCYVAFNSVSSTARTVTSVKNGAGTNLTLVGKQNLNNVATSGQLFLYKLTGATGSQTITVTMNSTSKLSIMAFAFTGVDHEILFSTQFASTTTMNVGPDTLRPSMQGVALFAVNTGAIGTPSGGTNFTTAQQASSGGGVTGAYSPTTNTTFAFSNGTSTPLAGMLLQLDGATNPTTTYATPGTYTQTVPASGTVDFVGLGAGGAGSGGGSNNGNPGAAGSWGTATSLSIGTDILAGSTITITVPTGPTGAASNANGANGGATTITYYDMSNVLQTLTCAGGAGGVGQTSSSTVNGGTPSPTSQTINGVKYQGGSGGPSSGTSGSHPSADGLPPGGGGGGLTAFSGTSGYGANGGAWVTIQ